MASATTCTQPATYYYSCVCGEKDDKTFEDGSVLGHGIVKHQKKSATCEEVGWDAYETCTRCNYTTYKEIPALKHNYGDVKCSRCGAPTPTKDLYYKLNSDGKNYSCTGFGSAKDNNVTIASIHNGLPVTSIDESVFKDCSELTSVIIPFNVTSMGEKAFDNCSGLTSIVIPNNITEIGTQVFHGCSALTKIVISKSVTNIDREVFNGCSNLKTIEFKGTKAQWNKISKNAQWKDGMTTGCVAKCTDGDISL